MRPRRRSETYLHIPRPLRRVALQDAVVQVMRRMAVAHVELAHALRLLIRQELGACKAITVMVAHDASQSGKSTFGPH